MGGRRARVDCGGSGTEMYFGDSGGTGARCLAWEVVVNVRIARVDGEEEVRDVRVHRDGRGIGGGILLVGCPDLGYRVVLLWCGAGVHQAAGM
jgi:hypothetical protein